MAIANAVDRRDYNRVLDLFTEDATLQSRDRPCQGRRVLSKHIEREKQAK